MKAPLCSQFWFKISSINNSSDNDNKLIRGENKSMKLFKGNEANHEIKLNCGRHYLCMSFLNHIRKTSTAQSSTYLLPLVVYNIFQQNLEDCRQ